MDTDDWVIMGGEPVAVSSGDEQLVCDGRTNSRSISIDVTNEPWG